jgi:hypothetical protein
VDWDSWFSYRNIIRAWDKNPTPGTLSKFSYPFVLEGWVDGRLNFGRVGILAEKAWAQLQDVGVDVKFQAIEDLEASIWLEVLKREDNDAPLIVIVMAGLYSFACGLRHAGTW